MRLGLFLIAALPLAAANPFVGRWDVTVTSARGSYPGWIEVTENDGALAARVQPRGGSVYPAPSVKMDGSRLIVVLARAAEKRPESRWELTAQGEKFEGDLVTGDQASAKVAGVRAPRLDRKEPKRWSKPESLFNGKDLTGWEPTDVAKNHWAARDGVLVNEDHGANLRSTRKFDDFKLHLEFSCPEKGNSGLYLRGRYEIQIEYEPAGVEDAYHRMGAIYGMVPVTGEVPRTPGEWEKFDVTLVGRTVTVVRNGVTIVDHKEIPGITGGALDSQEGEPGPFYIQGDHTGGMKFRNIMISTPAR